jgi:hypothetical protein
MATLFKLHDPTSKTARVTQLWSSMDRTVVPVVVEIERYIRQRSDTRGAGIFGAPLFEAGADRSRAEAAYKSGAFGDGLRSLAVLKRGYAFVVPLEYTHRPMREGRVRGVQWMNRLYQSGTVVDANHRAVLGIDVDRHVFAVSKDGAAGEFPAYAVIGICETDTVRPEFGEAPQLRGEVVVSGQTVAYNTGNAPILEGQVVVVLPMPLGFDIVAGGGAGVIDVQPPITGVTHPIPFVTVGIDRNNRDRLLMYSSYVLGNALSGARPGEQFRINVRPMAR